MRAPEALTEASARPAELEARAGPAVQPEPGVQAGPRARAGPAVQPELEVQAGPRARAESELEVQAGPPARAEPGAQAGPGVQPEARAAPVVPEAHPLRSQAWSVQPGKPGPEGPAAGAGPWPPNHLLLRG